MLAKRLVQEQKEIKAKAGPANRYLLFFACCLAEKEVGHKRGEGKEERSGRGLNLFENQNKQLLFNPVFIAAFN
jgi:hypothetical protein